MNHGGKKELLDLVSDYFLRDLSEEELSRLQEAVQSNEEIQQAFSEASRDEWLMHHVHHMNEGRIVHFKPRRRKQHLIKAIAAGVAILMSLGIVYVFRDTGSTQVVSTEPKPKVIAHVSDLYILEGEAVSVVNKGIISKMTPESMLHDGDRVVVPAGCRLSYQYLNEETHIEIGSGSLFKVTEKDHAKHILLRQGKLLADVAEQDEGKPMRIVTLDAEAVVLGTVLEIIADGITRLSVEEGKVRFKPITSDDSVVVTSGFTAEADAARLNSQPFRTAKFHPTEDHTLNYGEYPGFIAVDPEREYFGFLKFDLGRLEGRIEKAVLTLRVMKHQKDYGGSGEVRLCRVHPDNPLLGRKVQVSHYSGKVGGGMNLEFDIDPTQLSDGVNALMITLDEGGNDFWFSSSSGAFAPCLELKIIKDK